MICNNFILTLLLFSSMFIAASPTPYPNVLNFPTISESSLFDGKNLDALGNNSVITLVSTGDVIPARTVNFKMREKNDFKYPFAKTSEFLKSADLTLINLEAPLIKDCPVTTEGMVFCGDPKFIEGLLSAGVDVINIANNHSLNYGEKGLCETISLLQINNIGFSGAPDSLQCDFPVSNFYSKIIKGTVIGFLGFNILDNPPQDEIVKAITIAKNRSDFLIVSYHWGAEYVTYPAIETKNLAHKTIDAGANLIVGNHPHWIQPVEVYKEKLIIYSHGNFIFDQEWSNETKTGIISKIRIFKNRIVGVEFFPVLISDFSQPELLTGEKKEKILNQLKEISSF